MEELLSSQISCRWILVPDIPPSTVLVGSLLGHWVKGFYFCSLESSRLQVGPWPSTSRCEPETHILCWDPCTSGCHFWGACAMSCCISLCLGAWKIALSWASCVPFSAHHWAIQWSNWVNWSRLPPWSSPEAFPFHTPPLLEFLGTRSGDKASCTPSPVSCCAESRLSFHKRKLCSGFPWPILLFYFLFLKEKVLTWPLSLLFPLSIFF